VKKDGTTKKNNRKTRTRPRIQRPHTRLRNRDYEFDTVKQTSTFVHEYTNTLNPNIKLRIKDDFPLRIVTLNKKGNTTYGTTYNGDKQIKWKQKDDGPIEKIKE